MIQVPKELPDEYWMVEGCLTLEVFLKSTLKIFDTTEVFLIVERCYRDKIFTPIFHSLSTTISESMTSYGSEGPAKLYKILCSADNINALLKIFGRNAPPAICDSIFIIIKDEVSIMWFDPGSSPVIFSASVDEGVVKSFSEACGGSYKYQELQTCFDKQQIIRMYEREKIRLGRSNNSTDVRNRTNP